MSLKPEEELDPQFQAELERAKALSLEQYELDKIRQKRFSHSAIPGPSSATNSPAPYNSIPSNVQEYKHYLERKLGRPLSGGNPEGWNPPAAKVVPARRSSEIRPPSLNKLEVDVTATKNNQQKIDDLISFNAPSPTKPPDPQTEAHTNFKQLVDQMHKLNSQLQEVHTTNNFMRQPVLVGGAVQPMPSYGFNPAILPSANQQIVPYNPAQVAQMYPHLAPPQEKKPLTPDELQRLYSLNQVPSYNLSAASVGVGVVPRPLTAPSYTNPATAPVLPGIVAQPPYYPSYSMHYGNTSVVGAVGGLALQPPPQTVAAQQPQITNQPQPQSAYSSAVYSHLNMQVVPSTALVQQQGTSAIDTAPKLPPRNSLPAMYQPAPALPPRGTSPSNISGASIPHSNSTGQVNKFTEDVQLRRKFKEHKNPSGDLIDLSNGNDDSRVSVLEAFDPLLIGDRSSSEDDKESIQSSYYSEYDPFDYIYSGGTQYSDPVYDAVNRADKTPVSPGSSGSRPVGWYLPNTAEADTIKEEDEEPPPLPPRLTPTDEEMKNFSLERKRKSTKLYEDLVQRRMYERELIAFYDMVKEVRARYRYDDEVTNIGHVKAVEIENRYYPGTSIKLLVYPEDAALNAIGHAQRSGLQGGLEGYGQPVQFTCDITTSVEHVVMHVVCELEGQIHGSVSDYMLKTIAAQEWLSPSTNLNQLECVHNSIKLERDVQLGLCRKDPRLLKIIARTQQDDVRDAEITIENILPKEPSSSISYDQLIILLETLETEIDKLESAASDTNTRVLSCSGVVQGVKAICALLGSIDTAQISQATHELKDICDKGHRKFIYADGRLSGKFEVASEQGNYAEVILRPKTVYEVLQEKNEHLREAIRNLLEIYTNAFRVNFCVSTTPLRTKELSVLNVTRPISVHVNYLLRIPVIWKYDDYMLGAQIYHGARYLGYPVVTQCNNEVSGIYPRLKFDSWMRFDNIPVCTLPREARLIFVLYGCQNEPIEDPNNKGQEREKEKTTKVEIGWAAVQFFDFERLMIDGDLLLPIWPPTPDKYFCPAPGKGTHPLGSYYPVLGIRVFDYGGLLRFPEPRATLPTAPCLDFNSLDVNLQQELIDTAEQGYPLDKLDKREVLWEKRYYLHKLPHALPKILHAAYSWDYNSVSDLHAMLQAWTPLQPLQSLELMLPRYPDLEVRKTAVQWFSRISNDLLSDFLPQLLQALKHDTYEASPLARFLLCRALESPRVAHHLYWLLAHSLPGDAPQNENELPPTSDEMAVIQARYHRRYRLMLRALLSTCGEKLSARFLYQNMLCKELSEVAHSVKQSKESHRLSILRLGIEKVNQLLSTERTTALPLGPGLEVTGVSVQNCSYFNSNTLPLKIFFNGPDRTLLPAIFKCGDDLQQDMLTLQIVRIMDKLWLKEGLDLKMVTFDCVPTGDKKGMIEMVSDAETLRKIQVEWGLTGSFKDKPIAEWLAKQNPSQLEYERAVDNFTNSCAGYSVATYILGICDRHNDNIMLKTSGHLFHIDFGKFLGDAQMFGNFKRDRTPFVLTSDMAYVINGGDRPSGKFHHFVDLCCKAFNIVRKHSDLLLHVFALMATSGIPGVTAEAVTYVRNALLPGQSNPEAAASFAKMINISLQSWFTQFNFFLHNLAQMRFSSEAEGGALLSFVPRVYTMQQEGRLKSVMVHGYQKRYDLEKYYTYILRVTRQNQPDPSYLFRSWKEFCEFHQKLCFHFPLTRFHSLQTGIHVGRSNIKTVAERRLPVIKQFLISLFNSADEIAHSDLVYTFFHPLLRDQQEADIHVKKVKDVKPQIHPSERVGGELKLSLQYHRGALTVMVHHARSLPPKGNGEEPNTYVKVYLKPDRYKTTKRKTKVVRRNCFPSFMETLEYRMPLDVIQHRVLQATVWSHDSLQENEFLGGVELTLDTFNLKEEIIKWFPLISIPRSRV